MNSKLSWKEIEATYDQQWVQLINYDWETGDPYPSAGVVRIHAPTRKEFNNLVLQSPPVNAARVFVGQSKMPDEVFISSNSIKMTPCR